MEATSYLRFVLSLTAVIALIFAVVWMVKRWGLGAMVPRGGRRLALVESLSLDAKRRLVLVRRDDCEHLLLLGGGADLLIESDCPAARFTLPDPSKEAGA